MIAGLAFILAALTAVPLAILSAEVFAGLKRPQPSVQGTVPRTAVLIPAHDEAQGIAGVIAAMRPSGFRMLVVADNCSDDTAAVARAAGADVVERSDAAARGKGHALAFGRAALAAAPPDIVLVMDADCLPRGDALLKLATVAAVDQRVVQARYELDTRPTDTPITRISNFAFALKNVVRQRGLMRLAGTCVLTGTGMAFPWPLFRDAPLATDDSVEDLAIGLALVRAHHLPLYADDARVSSAPASGAAAITQRTRWEHGFVATARTVAPAMIAYGLKRRHWPSLWLGLHLLVPPLALTFGVASAMIMILLLLGLTAGFLPAFVLAFVMMFAGVAVLCGWRIVGRAILPFTTLLRVPIYIAWKLPIYLRLARGADRRWTRTERD